MPDLGIDPAGLAAVAVLNFVHDTSPFEPRLDDEVRALAAAHDRAASRLANFRVSETSPSAITIVTESWQLRELVSGLIDLHRDFRENACGVVIATGVAAGPWEVIRATGGDQLLLGPARHDAGQLAAHAAPHALLLARTARDMLRNEPYMGLNSLPDTSGRLVVRGAASERGISAYEILHSGHEYGLRGRRVDRRRRGMVIAWDDELDHGFLITDDGETYYTQARFLAGVDALNVHNPVYFVPKPPLKTGERRVAAAVVPLGTPLPGTVAGGSPTRRNIRIEDGEGNFQHVFYDGAEVQRYATGDPVAVTLTDATGELRVAQIDYREPDQSVSITDRFVLAVMEHLRARGASGAAQAVRRATKNLPSSMLPPTADYQRVMRLARYLLTDLAVPSLQMVGADIDARSIEGLAAVHDTVEVEWAASQLKDVIDGLPEELDPRVRQDIRPVLKEIRLALKSATQLPPPGAPPTWGNNPAARSAEHAGRALAEALLCGVVNAVPVQTKRVAELLDEGVWQ